MFNTSYVSDNADMLSFVVNSFIVLLLALTV